MTEPRQPNGQPPSADPAPAPGAASASSSMPFEFLRIPVRRLVIESPTIRVPLGPGDQALVMPGQGVVAGTPLVECTADPGLEDAGRLAEIARQTRFGGPANGLGSSQAHPKEERRTPPSPGKWWTSGDERRGMPAKRDRPRRLAGTLLFELEGRWFAAAGERHETIDSPAAGVVVEARSCIGITIKCDGVGIPGVVAGGQPARGRLEVRLTEGELRDAALDTSQAGAVVVTGGRVSTEALTRARAMQIRGIVAGSVGHAELRDLAASEIRQRAALHSMTPFAVLGLDGYQRRPIASPVLAILSALAGREVAILTDPAMLVLEVKSVRLPDLAPDAIRVRSGQHAGREGRWLRSAGLHRFGAGMHLEAAHVLLGDDPAPTIVPLSDLERFVV
jgi:hypothetical protein